MSRHRDYQPTIDRANKQAEIAKSREAKLRAKSDENHRGMLRALAAARIAGEEADALRDRITGLEQSVRDLKADARKARSERDAAAHSLACMTRELEASAEQAERRGPLGMVWGILRQWVSPRQVRATS